MKEGGKVITIKGIVIPMDWDERGDVIAAAISTHGEEEYLFDCDKKGKELIDYLQHEVEVTGALRENNNKKTLTITTYDVVRE